MTPIILPASDIGLENCSAPFVGLVLLGVRGLQQVGGSLWLALDFLGEGTPLLQIVCYPSDTESFPDPELVRTRRPLLMAAATVDRWELLHSADEAAFLEAVLEGDFELGGNFPRYRQYLEWLLTSARTLELSRVSDAIAGRST